MGSFFLNFHTENILKTLIICAIPHYMVKMFHFLTFHLNSIYLRTSLIFVWEVHDIFTTFQKIHILKACTFFFVSTNIKKKKNNWNWRQYDASKCRRRYLLHIKFFILKNISLTRHFIFSEWSHISFSVVAHIKSLRILRKNNHIYHIWRL